jgi:sugar lactone lactonase YvrE
MSVMREFPVEVALADRAEMGETPVWSASEGALYWIDIRRERVYRWHPASGARNEWLIGCTVGSIGLRQGGGLIVASRRGLEALDLKSGALTAIADPEAGLADRRLNDGKVDRAGRFWAGSVNDPGLEPLGRLYRFDPDGRTSAHDEGIVMSNSVAFAPDDRTFYFADSYRDVIWAYDFDLAEGRLSRKRVFATVPPGEGHPDGAAVDAEGCLWSARVGGGAIARYTPAGTLDMLVRLPATRVTCVAFGGSDLRTLFITTGISKLGPQELAAQPLAGSILALDVGVSGVPEPLFG